MRSLYLAGERVPAVYADSFWTQARGFRGRLSPPNHALVFEFDTVGQRTIDMLGVGFPLTVGFVVGERVREVVDLKAWSGLAPNRRADTIVELPPGVAEIAPGMEVRTHQEVPQ